MINKGQSETMNLDDLTKVKQVEGVRPENVDEILQTATTPIVLKGFCSDWPLVKEGLKGAKAAADFLMQYYQGMPVSAGYGEPEIEGRIFYNQAINGFNFKPATIPLSVALKTILDHQDNPVPPTAYVGSTHVDSLLPNFRNTHDAGIDAKGAIANIWIGNQSRIAAHYDFPDNLACCLVGRRRFTLFPPDQLQNLYVGPLEFAPGGQEISMVDFAKPDFEQFPKFANAIANAQVADLDSGDALFLPGMWWHHVEAFEALNVLMTHWWRPSPAHTGRPIDALHMAIMSVRNLPPEQRAAWKNTFDYYVFDQHSQDHIPEGAQGMLSSDMDKVATQKIKLNLIEKLKR